MHRRADASHIAAPSMPPERPEDVGEASDKFLIERANNHDNDEVIYFSPPGGLAKLLGLPKQHPHAYAHFSEHEGNMTAEDAALMCKLVDDSGIVAASVAAMGIAPFPALRCCVMECSTHHCENQGTRTRGDIHAVVPKPP